MNGTLIGNTLRGLIYTLRPGNLFYILLTAALIVVAGTLYLGDLTAHFLARAETDTFTWIPPTPRVWGILAVIFLLFVAKTLDNAARIYAGHKNASFLPLSEATAGDLFHYLIGLFFFAILLGAAPFICYNLGIGKNITPYLNGACALIACLLLPALPLSYLNERNASTMLDFPSLAAAIGSIGIVRYLILLILISGATAGVGYAIAHFGQQHLGGQLLATMDSIAANGYDYSKIPLNYYQNAAIIAALACWLIIYIYSAAAWTYPREGEDDEPAMSLNERTRLAITSAHPDASPATAEPPSDNAPQEAPAPATETSPSRLRRTIAAARAVHKTAPPGKQEPQLTAPDAPPPLLRGTSLSGAPAAEKTPAADKQEPQLTDPDAPPPLLRGSSLSDIPAAEKNPAADKQEPQLSNPDAPPRLLRTPKTNIAAVADKSEPHLIPPELELLKEADVTRMRLEEQQTFARVLAEADEHFKHGQIDAGLALLAPYTDTQHDPAIYFPAYQRRYALQPQDTLLHRLMVAAARGSTHCYDLIQPELERIHPAELPADIIRPLAQQAAKRQQYPTVLALTRHFAKNHPEHPHLADNYYLAALALAHNGQTDKALTILQQLLTRYPDHPHRDRFHRAAAQLQDGQTP